MSEATQRTRAPRPMSTGTLRLKPRQAPKAETAPVVAPTPPPATAAEDEQINRRVADLALCRERFPALFDADRPQPLAIGTHKPLAELIGLERAQSLLEWWTGWPPYLAAIEAGGPRYNLDGTEAGAISKPHRRRARTIIASRAAAGKQPTPEKSVA